MNKFDPKPDGCFNESADKVRRVDETWSDTNLNDDYSQQIGYAKPEDVVFHRLKCRNCEELKFEVMQTGAYETSARCCSCGMWYIVHCG